MPILAFDLVQLESLSFFCYVVMSDGSILTTER